MRIRITSHARYDLWYHVVFCTKYRKQVFNDEKTQKEVALLFREIALYKDAVVYGLDFGNIYEINKDLKSDRLKLFSGYPLSILEEFVKKGEQFDYVLFSRVANLININELMSYMEVLTKIAKNICMLEVVKLFGNATTKVDINKIRVTKSMKAYSGVYIHNYPALLRKFGYVVMEAKILSPYSFEQYFSDDHYFIYIHGRKGDIEN